ALIIGFANIALITPYVAGILFFIIFAWIVAAKSLSKQFAKLTAVKDDVSTAEPVATTKTATEVSAS
ncbi:MAG TPA: Npt1/Npt2 family nucleotide transporter, partial [Rhabdochlamydiaceae bacterium]